MEDLINELAVATWMSFGEAKSKDLMTGILFELDPVLSEKQLRNELLQPENKLLE